MNWRKQGLYVLFCFYWVVILYLLLSFLLSLVTKTHCTSCANAGGVEDFTRCSLCQVFLFIKCSLSYLWFNRKTMTDHVSRVEGEVEICSSYIYWNINVTFLLLRSIPNLYAIVPLYKGTCLHFNCGFCRQLAMFPRNLSEEPGPRSWT